MLIVIVLGVSTVDDLLERIDEGIEKAKVVVNNSKKDVSKTDSSSTNEQSKADEPIRIVYGDIHCIEDLLDQLNDQPGDRKVVLEGAPDQSSTVSLKKSTSHPDEEKTTVTSTKKETTSTPEDTTDDQIHVNIDDIRSVDDLLNRVDEAVQHTPVVIDIKPQASKPSGTSRSFLRIEENETAALDFSSVGSKQTSGSSEREFDGKGCCGIEVPEA